MKASPKSSMIKLIAGSELVSSGNELGTDYGIKLPVKFEANMFPILAVNLKIIDVKYRSFFVTMLGSPKPNYYQLFTIPTDRLYKEKLFFHAYDSVSGKQLATYSLFIAQSPPPKILNR